jgi:serine/threonine-protein kinase
LQFEAQHPADWGLPGAIIRLHYLQMAHTDQLRAALAGRYSIEQEIGVGGMATVYRARDVKHERRVALKVLKPELGAVLGTDRFLAEIRVTANLQHPNLLPLFDSGEADGLLFYVMPFVEGESLRACLNREKQLPVDEAVRLAMAVASALDHAHRHGVIHRDLKPENILLHEGQPLVADFGIALAVSNAGGNRITQTGLSLGTPQYMSPEQATGDRQIDARTDVYSLGAVLYEMLNGDPPHLGGTAQAVIAKVLTERPHPIRTSRPSVPSYIDASVLRALEKLPADRFASAREFADALLGRSVVVPADAPPPATVHPTPPPTRSAAQVLRAGIPWLLALASAAAAAIGWGKWERRALPPTTRFVLDIPPTQRFTMVNGIPVVFSPDARAVVYAGIGGPQGRQLYYRRLDGLEARALPGTDNASAPFFSPDGRTVGFSQGSALRTVAVSGGAPTTIAASAFRSPTWTESGDMYLGSTAGLRRIRAGGGTPEVLTEPDTANGELSHGTPILAPDGETLIFWVRAASPGTDHLSLYHIDSKQITDIEGEATNPLGVVDGYLIFGRNDGTLNAVRYDPRKLRSLVDAVQVLDGVTWRGTGGVAASLSRDGSLVYVRGGISTQLVITDASGRGIGGTKEGRDFTDPNLSPPAFSPDGRRVAVAIFESGGSDIWLYDVSTSILSRLTSHRGIASNPAWTPDGTRVAFVDRANGSVWWIRADGSAPEEQLEVTRQTARAVAFSPDGKYAVINGTGTGAGVRGVVQRAVIDRTTAVAAGDGPSRQMATGDGASDIQLLPLSGDRKRVPWLHTQFAELNPTVSPDGKWIAYQSNVTGHMEIYIRPFPGPAGAIQLSAAATGASDPRWTRDGRLIYRAGDSLVVATLVKGTSPTVAQQRTLFEIPNSYGASADGTRFAILRSLDNSQQVVVVLNWINELRAKLAAAKR